jgi:hypothetical protein
MLKYKVLFRYKRSPMQVELSIEEYRSQEEFEMRNPNLQFIRFIEETGVKID